MKSKITKFFVLICILGIIFLISGILLFNKKEVKKDEYQINTKNLNDISISEGVAAVISNNFNVYGCMDLFFSYFTDKKVTVYNLSKNTIDSTILNLVNIHGVEIKEGEEFTQKTVKKYVESFYGKDYKYQYNNIENICPNISYDSTSKKYIVQKSDCDLTCKPRSLRKLVQAKENDSIMELYYRILFIKNTKKSYKYYSDYNRTKKIDVSLDLKDISYGNIEDGISGDIINKGSLYKVTFVKEDKNYVFLMSEPVNK